MEQIIRLIDQRLEYAIGRLRREHRSKQYQSLQQCPSYGETKALVDAINRLERYEYGKERTKTVQELVGL